MTLDFSFQNRFVVGLSVKGIVYVPLPFDGVQEEVLFVQTTLGGFLAEPGSLFACSGLSSSSSVIVVMFPIGLCLQGR